MYHGDIRLGDTIDLKFTTVDTSGVPTTLAGTPVVSAYPANSTTELTAGITLTVDFDARTGLHNIRVVASGGNGYATATNYTLVITTGTVGGSSVVGYVVGSFSIENRSALMPTVAARTADVSATGEVDANVTQWLGTAAATPTVAGVPEVDLTHLVGVAQSATDLKDFADDGYDPATNKVQGVVLTDTVTTYTGNTPQTGDSFARLGAPVGASLSADIAAVEAQTDDIGVAGAGLTALGDARLANLDAAVTTRAVAGDAMALTVAERAATADKLLGRTRAGGADGGRTVAECLAFGRNKWAVAGGVLTVYDDDDLTPLWTAAVTTAAGDPVDSVDPV